MVSMSAVWDRTTEFVSDELPALLPVAVLSIFLPATVQANLEPIANTGDTAKLIVGAVGLVLAVVSLWGQLVVTALALDPIAGRAEATRRATARLPTIVLVLVIMFLGLVVLVAPLVIGLVLAGMSFDDLANGGGQDLPPGALGFMALYLVAFLPLLLWLVARLVLVTPVVVWERRGIGALNRSFALTRGLVWKLVGVVLLYTVVAYVAGLAAQTVFGSILRLIVGGEGVITVASVLTAIMVGLVSTVFTVLAAAFAAKLYRAVCDARGQIVDGA